MNIGIMTMHKVQNFGSALQAFALLRVLRTMGHSAELIDYEFKKKETRSFKQRVISFICSLRDILRANPERKQAESFQSFYSKYYHYSVDSYSSEIDLLVNPPLYDCYITGSDQVWNPLHIVDDKSFLLSFAPDNKKKISYASSFSTASLPRKYEDVFRQYLSRYDYISVREQSGQIIVKDLLGFIPRLVCDPTLLLNQKQWLEIIEDNWHYSFGEKPYILVYILKYAYDPFPYINEIIDNVANRLGYTVLSINSPHGLKIQATHKDLRGLGPIDFLRLFAKASFVITTSFHGTAFALNFHKNFISVVNDNKEFDTRMIDLLRIVGAEDRAVIYNNPGIFSLDVDYEGICPRLKQYRSESLDYLIKALS